jgi:hypothetical protein
MRRSPSQDYSHEYIPNSEPDSAVIFITVIFSWALTCQPIPLTLSTACMIFHSSKFYVRFSL